METWWSARVLWYAKTKWFRSKATRLENASWKRGRSLLQSAARPTRKQRALGMGRYRHRYQKQKHARTKLEATQWRSQREHLAATTKTTLMLIKRQSDEPLTDNGNWRDDEGYKSHCSFKTSHIGSRKTSWWYTLLTLRVNVELLLDSMNFYYPNYLTVPILCVAVIVG